MYQLQREKNTNVIFYASAAIGLVFAILNLIFVIFDMSVSVLFYKMINIPSITYFAYHLLAMYIPLLLIIPNGRFPKALIIKWVLYGISLCYILGSTWIFYYIYDNSIAGIFTDTLENFQSYQRNLGLMFNYLAWDCYSPVNLIFSLLEALLLFISARSVTTDRLVFAVSLGLAVAFCIFAPILYNVISSGDFISNDWLEKNAYILGSQIMSAIALISIASLSRLWGRLMWRISLRR